MNNFHYAQFLMQQLYDIQMSQIDFEELGMIAYRKIGNHRWRTYRYTTPIVHHKVELPCNFSELESVTAPFEDWNRTTNTETNGDLNSQWVEQYTESRKIGTAPLYNSGHFIHYEKVGDILYFKVTGVPVCILYRGEELDDTGLPCITDREAEAIAAFVAYTVKYKTALKENNQVDMQAAALLKNDWALKCDQARVPDHVTQNEMDEVLDARANWNRKSYGKSLKPIE